VSVGSVHVDVGKSVARVVRGITVPVAREIDIFVDVDVGKS
jgi:hypothetical protein